MGLPHEPLGCQWVTLNFGRQKFRKPGVFRQVHHHVHRDSRAALRQLPSPPPNTHMRPMVLVYLPKFG